MKNLLTLIGAGYRHGYVNGHGADGTVSDLEWALNHLDSSADTAETYSRNASMDLEARLFGAYVVRSLASLKLGQVDKAKIEYDKAQALAGMSRQSHGLIPTLSADKVEEVLAILERRLRAAGATV